MKKVIIGLGVALAVLLAAVGISEVIIRDERSSYLQEVPFSQLQEEVETGEIVIGYYSSKGCDFCKQFEPILVTALNDLELQARKIETSDSENEDAWDHMNDVAIQMLGTSAGTPMVIIYRDGEPIDAITGKVELETIIEFFNEAINTDE